MDKMAARGIPYGALVLVTLTLLLNSGVTAEEESPPATPPDHTNIILIGATGDLATKYLWRGLFDLFKKTFKRDKHHFTIYACARKIPDEGRTLLSQILLGVVQCSDEQCRSVKKDFVEATQYHQLKKEEHYKELGNKIAENTQSLYGLQGTQRSTEHGRLVYLSIPPSSYAKTSVWVNKYLRPHLGRPWFRVVLEKPFGRDYESAVKLASDLDSSFEQDEVYRIDHYLGKNIVSLILPFRYRHDELGRLWNRQYIERVDIVMKESLGVKDRISFYDDIGVVRDVMQNHLTELLCLVAMEIPQNSGNISEILREKLNVLKYSASLDFSHHLIGQYLSYAEEARIELKKDNYTSLTPTFAASLLHINTPRWQGVPFILTSGKQLDEKASYIRVLFKNNEFCMDLNNENCADTKEVIFYIGGVGSPMILVSKSLGDLVDFPRWKVREKIDSDMRLFGEEVRSGRYSFLLPEDDSPAYSQLIDAVFEGQRHRFTSLENLLESWRIWDNVIKPPHDHHLQLYEGLQARPDQLNFYIHSHGIQFANKNVIKEFNIKVSDTPTFGSVPGTLHNGTLVAGSTDEMIARLAKDMFNVAVASVEARGVFHLALPGGKSPAKLLPYLFQNIPLFPWQQTVIWQVDERCIAASSVDSNMHMLEENLLQHVRVKFSNIKAMPVNVYDVPCDSSDHGDTMYETWLKKHTSGMVLDFILVGMGLDGHVASLFPHQPSLQEKHRFVIYSNATEGVSVPQRMTMTLRTLNNAHHLGIIVTGKWKNATLRALEGGDSDSYPVLRLQPTHGTKTWYIDHDALFG